MVSNSLRLGPGHSVGGSALTPLQGLADQWRRAFKLEARRNKLETAASALKTLRAWLLQSTSGGRKPVAAGLSSALAYAVYRRQRESAPISRQVFGQHEPPRSPKLTADVTRHSQHPLLL